MVNCRQIWRAVIVLRAKPYIRVVVFRMQVAGLVAHWPQTRVNVVSAGKVCISIMGFVSKENRALIVFGKRL